MLFSCLLCFSVVFLAKFLGFRRLWLSTPLSHCRTNHVLCRVQYSGGQHRALYARNCPPSCHTSRPI